MSGVYPAFISFALSSGIFLMVYTFVRARQSNPLARMEREAPSRNGSTPEQGKGRRTPASDYLNKRMSGSSYGDRIARRLVQADLRLTPAEFVVARIGTAAVGAVLGLFVAYRMGLPGFIGVLVLGFAGYMAPSFLLGFRRRKRIASFNAQLADSTMMLANSLKAGYSLLQSMDLMSRDAPLPTAIEFRRVVQEVGVGLPLGEALANLLRRVPSAELDIMITAIGIQQEVGGNLAQVLEGIAHTIRERVRIKGEIKVLTSQGRYSGYVITALPILLGLLITLINPEYMSPMWHFPWIVMPVISLVMIGMAYFIIMKIVNIEV